jgi:hypothetical protein
MAPIQGPSVGKFAKSRQLIFSIFWPQKYIEGEKEEEEGNMFVENANEGGWALEGMANWNWCRKKGK